MYGFLCDGRRSTYPYDKTLCQYTADNAPFDTVMDLHTPFATVMQGMEVFVSGTTMSLPSPVPEQFTYGRQGNPWMLQHYPTIDIIQGVGVGGVAAPHMFFSLHETSTETTTAHITTTESPTTSATTSTATTTDTETSFNETVAPSTDESLNGTTNGT